MPFICSKCGCYMNTILDRKYPPLDSVMNHAVLISELTLTIGCNLCNIKEESIQVKPIGTKDFTKLWNANTVVKDLKDCLWKVEERLRLREFLKDKPSKSEILLYTAREKNEHLRKVLVRLLKRKL